MKQIFLATAMFVCLVIPAIGQVGVNTDGSSPNNAAILDVKSTTKGFLPPRMTTTEMNAIQSPPAGLMVYNTTLNTICWFNGSTWSVLASGDGRSCGSVTYNGKTYNAVFIGLQCWMDENLNTGTMIDGTADQTNNSIVEKYCYSNLGSNCDIYGGMYQWAEAVQYLNGATNTASWNPVPTGPVQGICPAGWHVPSDDEWTTLTTYLGGTITAGGKM